MSKTESTISTNTMTSVSVEPHFNDSGNVSGSTITVNHNNGHQCIGVVDGLMPGDAARLPYDVMGETIVKDCHSH